MNLKDFGVDNAPRPEEVMVYKKGTTLRQAIFGGAQGLDAQTSGPTEAELKQAEHEVNTYLKAAEAMAERGMAGAEVVRHGGSRKSTGARPVGRRRPGCGKEPRPRAAGRQQVQRVGGRPKMGRPEH